MNLRLVPIGLCILFILACVGKAVMDDRRDAHSVAKAYSQDDDNDASGNPGSIAGMKLQLLRQRITRKNEYATFYGVVRNIGTAPIPDGEVTISEINRDGYQIGEIPGTLDVDPLPPGHDSTIQIQFPIRDADVKWVPIFTSAGSPAIPLSFAPTAALVLK